MSTTTDSSTRQAQLAAIEDSGVAEPFHLLQLRNPAFWVYAWGTLAGIIGTIRFYEPGVGNYGGALVGGVIAFAIYTVPWLLFLHWMDRYTPLRPGLLAAGALWGGFAATMFLALTVNNAMLSLYGKWFGTAWAADWAAGGTAPITEETAKVIGFVLLLGLAPKLIRSAYDAFILGAFIGIGFEVTEDVLYVFNGAGKHFASNQIADSIQVIALRSASGLVSHAAFSALVCCGLFWILGRDPRGRHVVKGLLLIVVGMALHGSWDVSARARHDHRRGRPRCDDDPDPAGGRHRHRPDRRSRRRSHRTHVGPGDPRTRGRARHHHRARARRHHRHPSEPKAIRQGRPRPSLASCREARRSRRARAAGTDRPIRRRRQRIGRTRTARGGSASCWLIVRSNRWEAFDDRSCSDRVRPRARTGSNRR